MRGEEAEEGVGSGEGPGRSSGPGEAARPGSPGDPGGARGAARTEPGAQAGRVRGGTGEAGGRPGPAQAVIARGRAWSAGWGGPGEGTGCGRGLRRRHRGGCAEPRRTLTEAPGHEGPGRAGDSRGWGRPGAKAARGGGREGAQTSDPAPPLTRFSSSASASAARAAAATTTSHCLFGEPQARSPRLLSAPPGPPRRGRRGPSLAAAAATLPLLWRSRLSHWPSSAQASPPAPTKPRHARTAPPRRQLLRLVPAAVLPALPWRRIPAHGRQSAPSLAQSAVTPVWVRLFGSKWKGGGLRRVPK